MNKCPNCGKEVEDNVRICPDCGAYIPSEVENAEQPEIIDNKPLAYEEMKQEVAPESAAPRVLGILSLVFGLLGGIAGIVCGIIGLALDKKRKYTAFYIAGIVLTIIWIILLIVLYSTNVLDLYH